MPKRAGEGIEKQGDKDKDKDIQHYGKVRASVCEKENRSKSKKRTQVLSDILTAGQRGLEEEK